MNNYKWSYLLLGFIIIIYTFYRRFLRIRLPKDLCIFIDDYLNYRLLILIILSIIICNYVIYKSLSSIYKKEKKNNIFTRFFDKINDIIDDSLHEAFCFIANLFPENYAKISYISQKFYKYFQHQPEYFFLFILYFIRIVILMSFLIDVFIFFRFEYMYKSLYLLCFTIIIKIIFYIFREFAKNIDFAKSILIIEDGGLDTETGLPKTWYSLKEEHKDLDLDYHIGQYILCSKMSGYLEYYDRYAKVFNPYFNLILYSFYLMGWCFILFKNIYLLFFK